MGQTSHNFETLALLSGRAQKRVSDARGDAYCVARPNATRGTVGRQNMSVGRTKGEQEEGDFKSKILFLRCVALCAWWRQGRL